MQAVEQKRAPAAKNRRGRKLQPVQQYAVGPRRVSLR